MIWVVALFSILGFNLFFWSMVGLTRFFVETYTRKTERDVQLSQFGFLLGATVSVLGLMLSAFGILAYLAKSIPPRASLAAELNGYWQFDQNYFVPVLLWLFFAVLGGYASARVIRQVGALRLFTVAITHWFVSHLIAEKYLSFFMPWESPQVIAALSFSMISVLFGQWLAVYASRKPVDTAHDSPVLAQPVLGLLTAEQVAVVIPAHNEELIIAKAITELSKQISPANIFIGSDASTDRTVEIARSFGCTVADIQPNRGKAGVLDYVIRHYNLAGRYSAVLILDADTHLDRNYLNNALPYFNDPKVIAIAGHAVSKWQPWSQPFWSRLIAAYRTRLYHTFQYGIRFGQSWLNITTCIPGFASMYRASILREIEINPPGLIIEDFNMTFEVQRKGLGKVVYVPSIIASTEDPHTVRDYAHQVRRWCLGLWQTIRRHGIWPSRFWAAQSLLLGEVIFFSFFILLSPVFALQLSVRELLPAGVAVPLFTPVSFADLLIGIFIADYALTVLVAFIVRRPALLLYGPFFIVFRLIDAAMFLYTLPLTFFVRSEGRWISPQRQLV